MVIKEVDTDALVNLLIKDIALSDLEFIAPVVLPGNLSLEMVVNRNQPGGNVIVEFISHLDSYGGDGVRDLILALLEYGENNDKDYESLRRFAESCGFPDRETASQITPDYQNTPLYNQPGAGIHLSRFMGRKPVWDYVKDALGVNGPEQKLYESLTRRNDCKRSVALSVKYEHSDDCVHDLGKSLSDYLSSEGQLTVSGQADYLRLKSFNWPDSGSLSDIFGCISMEYAEAEAMGQLNWLYDEHSISQNFTGFLQQSYARNPDQAAVILTTLHNADENKLADVDRLVAFWNRLDWGGLEKRVVLLIFYRPLVKQNLLSRVLGFGKSTLDSGPCIGELDADCLDAWKMNFLTNRLKIPDSQPLPDWWNSVDSFVLKAPCRLKVFQNIHFNQQADAAK